MTALQELNAYLRKLELRVRLLLASRGAALVISVALALTVLLVWIANRYQFTEHLVFPFRLVLFIAVAAALASLLAWPLWRLNRRLFVHQVEQHVTGLEQRLLTIAERPDASNPFTEIVAEDALRIAREQRAEDLASTRSLFAFGGAAALASIVLVWLIAAGPGYWGYGASLLWTGSANAGKRPLYDIAVRPGNKIVRRKSDQLVTAQLLGFSARNITLYARSGSATKWEQTPMQPQPGGNGFRFLFAGLSDPVEYYVQAGAYQSRHYTLGVKDLPGVERVRVALHFPPALHLRDTVTDPGGDIRAVQGSQADISVLTDKRLDHGFLTLENGTKIELARADGNWLTAHIPINRDGSYHVATLDNGEAVRLSGDYFIEAKKDELPSVRILRPGADPHVSPIEELPITVDAADDFGLEGLDLRYSVNGGPEQTVPLLKSKGTKEAQGSSTLYFENLKVEPGDVVSFYASARDANTMTRTAILFAQAEPFDFKFSQSQQAGGMGMGSGGQDDNISERQKHIIAATFNELNSGNAEPATIKEHARFLSDVEFKLSDQAKTLAERMNRRDLPSTSAQFEQFSKLMTQASLEMNDAVSQLKPGKWHDALPPEQKALQSLLRADALFRDIQVAYGRMNGGMGSGAQRDLARMFDLELDTSKNQYETGQSTASSNNEQQKAVDEAFERLQALARRQQELAQQASQQQALEQRWQEEQLRREAEQLRQQMQQLAQNSQGQQSSSPQNGQQSSSSESQSSRQGSSASRMQSQQTAEAVRRATNALERAEDEMRKAVSDHDATAEQRASSQLAQAESALNNMLHQQAGGSLAELSDRAQQIADAQKDVANRLKQTYGARSGRNETEVSSNAGSGEMPEMDDPTPPRWPYNYRRRLFQPLPPSRPASEQERSIAREKEALGEQLEQLEQQLQQQQQNLAATQPEAASKLRKALSEAEEKELVTRMQKNADWIRQGYGERNLDMEDSVTAGVEQLSRDLRGVEQTLNSSKPGSQNAPGDEAARALAQVRSLREQLERGQQQSAQQQGRSGTQPQQGAFNPNGDAKPAIGGSDVQDAIDQLTGLRGQLGPGDHALGGLVDGTLGYLHHLNNADPSLLDGRIGRDAVANLERLEAELSRRVAQQQIQGARTGAPESAPEKYRDAVAEYFRKLSQ